MGFMDSMKKAAALTKLQGELVMIDREITTCKEKHGVIIYNILSKRQHLPDDDENKFAALPMEGLEAAFLATTEDLKPWNEKRNKVADELEVLEDSKMRRTSGTTTGDKARYAGQVLKDATVTAKLKTELAYYDREIKLRQGIFGIQVFDDLKLMELTEPFPEDDIMIGEVLNKAKEEMESVLKRKEVKLAEIEAARSEQSKWKL